MKTKNLSWLIIILLIVAIVATLYLNQNLSEEQSPLEVSQNFYQNWLNYEGNPMANKTYSNSPYLSKNLKNEINNTVESFDQFGAYDPVLCAQEKPSNFQANLLNESENLALVEMSLDYYGQDKLINLELIKEENNWYITKINCPTENINNDELVIDYISSNISDLSPEPEVLGGTFYVTNLEKIGDNVYYVEYEDGHIALSAQLEYEINEEGKINIHNFNIID